MTDLERFFRRLVETLSAIDPAHLYQPVSVAEIRGSIMPYRTNRRALHLETSEDYELVLMRLCAGEGGYATVTPDEARARFKLELASPNPDLGALGRFNDAAIKLAPGWVVAALTAAGEFEPERIMPDAPAETFVAPAAAAVPAAPVHAAVATPAARPTPAPVPAPAPAAPREPTAAPKSAAQRSAPRAAYCVGCGEALPDRRAVKFCPHCGTSQVPARCAGCGSDLESGWRFCTACGRGVA